MSPQLPSHAREQQTPLVFPAAAILTAASTGGEWLPILRGMTGGPASPVWFTGDGGGSGPAGGVSAVAAGVAGGAVGAVGAAALHPEGGGREESPGRAAAWVRASVLGAQGAVQGVRGGEFSCRGGVRGWGVRGLPAPRLWSSLRSGAAAGPHLRPQPLSCPLPRLSRAAVLVSLRWGQQPGPPPACRSLPSPVFLSNFQTHRVTYS